MRRTKRRTPPKESGYAQSLEIWDPPVVSPLSGLARRVIAAQLIATSPVHPSHSEPIMITALIAGILPAGGAEEVEERESTGAAHTSTHLNRSYVAGNSR